MRVATFVLSVLIVGVMLLQSCAVYGLGSMADALSEKPTGYGDMGAAGIVVALAAFVGMAFVLKKPLVAFVSYGLAALLAFGVGALGFSDMNIWGVVLIGLALMALWGKRES